MLWSGTRLTTPPSGGLCELLATCSSSGMFVVSDTERGMCLLDRSAIESTVNMLAVSTERPFMCFTVLTLIESTSKSSSELKKKFYSTVRNFFFLWGSLQ